jgi:hypothetical protein
MPVADLHAPVRSTYEQVVIKATGGTTWRSEPRALPLPHVSFSGEIPRTFNEVLATTRPTDTARNADLLARLAKGEALAITRQGDGGEVFSTLSATPPSTVARDRLLASALAEATSKLAPCQPGPPLSIPPVREREPWPFLYLRPEDASVLADAPTLDEVVKVTPAWGGGAVEGHTLLDCTRDEYDRLACRAERSQPAWVGQISVPIANRITLAERLPDGRRTAGLALLLSMTWDKDAIRYAIAPPTGPAIPPPTPNAAPAP